MTDNKEQQSRHDDSFLRLVAAFVLFTLETWELLVMTVLALRQVVVLSNGAYRQTSVIGFRLAAVFAGAIFQAFLLAQAVGFLVLGDVAAVLLLALVWILWFPLYFVVCLCLVLGLGISVADVAYYRFPPCVIEQLQRVCPVRVRLKRGIHGRPLNGHHPVHPVHGRRGRGHTPALPDHHHSVHDIQQMDNV